MKRLYRFLQVILFGFVGTFIGTSLYKWYDYKKHPDLYAMQSAPWYLSIEINAIFTLVIVVVILIIMLVVKKKMK
jgi:uncharacterized membrane protein